MAHYEAYFFFSMYGQLFVTLIITLIVASISICCVGGFCKNQDITHNTLYVKIIIEMAKILYGANSVKLNPRDRPNYVKIGWSYFKLNRLSIALLLFQNIVTIGILLSVSIGFLFYIHVTYACTTAIHPIKL